MGSSIIIDGYNLIRQSATLRSIEEEDIQAGREALIEHLRRYKKLRGGRITVVFDGEGSFYPGRQNMYQKGIQILYSSRGEKADDVIKRLVSTGGEGVIIVTSDREVASYGRIKGAAVVDSLQFERRMQMAFIMEEKGEELQDEDGARGRISTQKKGPSRRLRKRRRKEIRRLMKL